MLAHLANDTWIAMPLTWLIMIPEPNQVRSHIVTTFPFTRLVPSDGEFHHIWKAFFTLSHPFQCRTLQLHRRLPA